MSEMLMIECVDLERCISRKGVVGCKNAGSLEAPQIAGDTQ